MKEEQVHMEGVIIIGGIEFTYNIKRLLLEEANLTKSTSLQKVFNREGE